jgi:hypothetical protein
MYQLNNIKPIQLNDLVRVGKQSDGGYVLPTRLIDRSIILLSFGIDSDWSFETDFLRRKKDAILYAFDYSVSPKIISFRKKKTLLSLIMNLLSFNFSGAKDKAKLFKALRSFNSFFDDTKGRYFIKKFVGYQTNGKYISVQGIFDKYLLKLSDLSIFVKMDIENSEYRTLLDFKPYWSKINGFVVEFHELDILGDKFDHIIQELSAEFYVAHVHANNYSEYIYQTKLPKTLEITFINKRLVTEEIKYSTYTYPIKGLDFRCNPKAPDISIGFGFMETQ